MSAFLGRMGRRSSARASGRSAASRRFTSSRNFASRSAYLRWRDSSDSPAWPTSPRCCPAGRPGCRGGSAHVGLGERLAAEERAEDRGAQGDGGVPGRLVRLGLLALQPLAGAADLLLQRRPLRRVLGAQGLDLPVALLARRLRHPQAELPLRLRRPRDRLDLGAVPQVERPLAIEVVLQRLGPLGIALAPRQLRGSEEALPGLLRPRPGPAVRPAGGAAIPDPGGAERSRTDRPRAPLAARGLRTAARRGDRL